MADDRVTYADLWLGELRLMDAYVQCAGFDHVDVPDAFAWRPRSAARWRAPMLARVAAASRILGIRYAMRRAYRVLRKTFTDRVVEWELFDDLDDPPVLRLHRPERQ